ncbi:MerR family transcriptional regulator [Streptomyces sp. A3M-1-3]|uniref:MerR family transcriptional regulator n=1 Tax=Streptomyces sp. A3M-1-3 TaxID=2962044 RepID=UPI0020B64228|nr:MerR family transcriptional regulator [Streptomyces sp. A3M-1-3]MCP3820339.1 MerR family transcriptional regulator [Streptomyces sp. A3M-1-3]
MNQADQTTDGAALLTIGAFSARSRLSPKALRLYDRLGLLAPARVDESSGYRWYRTDQVAQARLVALLRRIDMPLAEIAEIVGLPGPQAAAAVATYWAAVEERITVQRAIASHLRDRLSGRKPEDMYEIKTCEVAEQAVLAVRKHLLADELPQWIPATFDRLVKAAEDCGGIAGIPFVAYYADVTEESDGPAEACVPVSDVAAAEAYAAVSGASSQSSGRSLALRIEPAQRFAYARVNKEDVVFPRIAAAFEAVEDWVQQQGLTVTGPCREIYFADWDAAGPADPVCDVAFPIAPIA